MTTNRIPYIDTAKTICIFLMIVGHWRTSGLLHTYIYSFHMPALFVISGFLYKPHSWKRTVVSLGIPVLFFSLINLIYLVAMGRIVLGYYSIRDLFFSFFHYRYGLSNGLYCGDWFIWALFAIRLLYGDLFKGLIKYYLPISSVMVVYMAMEMKLWTVDTIFRGWFIGRLVPCMPFFCLGFYLKDKEWKPENVSIKAIVSLCIFALTLPLINGNCGLLENAFGISYLVFCINAMLTTLLLFIISFYIQSNSFFETISKGTLLILGIHMPLLELVEQAIPSIMSFLSPFIVIAICYYPIKWLNSSCPLLLGKYR